MEANNQPKQMGRLFETKPQKDTKNAHKVEEDQEEDYNRVHHVDERGDPKGKWKKIINSTTKSPGEREGYLKPQPKGYQECTSCR